VSSVPGSRPAQSEVTSPERRGFIVVLGGMSLLFLAAESPAFARQPGYVLAARLVMSALLLAAPVLLSRPLGARTLQAVVNGLAAGVCLSFAAIAWGTGGTQSPYFAFLPMLSLVFTIAVPDAPVGSLVAGLSAGGVGLARVWAEGAGASQAAFWVLAFGSTTVYAVTGSIFHRRQRARERRLEAERARAEEVLAESERQRARAERLALVGRLAAGVAHDVASPLAAVGGGVGEIERRVREQGVEDAELAATFLDLRSSLERLRRTVDDLRRAAHAELGATEPCDLAVVAEEARVTLSERFRAAVTVVREPAELPRLVAVRAPLVNALVWLLVDASGRGVRRIRIAARREGADVLVELRDDARDLSVAPLDLPAATVAEPGLAVALAREDLSRAGCLVEDAPRDGELRLPLLLRCRAAPGEPANAGAAPAARLA
jgi:signal transduction histidine kinase